MKLTLVSHALCPYVQRIAIALAEKGVPFERVTIDLASKPDWFLAVSPLGKVPVLIVEEAHGRQVLFESVAILEFLEDVAPAPLYAPDPARRAAERAWVAAAGQILDRIGAFYAAGDPAAQDRERARLAGLFARVEEALGQGPWFDGARFGMVDAVFASVFRYFDVFDRLAPHGILDGLPKLAAWRGRIAARPSVVAAVGPDYEDRLVAFLTRRGSLLVANMAPA